MANSFAFVISKNTYPDAFQANLIGVDQGTRIVYSATDTLTSQSVLYADSRLTQPIYGDPTLWIGAQLLTDDSVKYALSINNSGTLDPVSNPTTTTTTTTGPTTTTTTQAVFSVEAVGANDPGVACAGAGNYITVYYSGSLGVGTALYLDSGLTTPYNRNLYGLYLRIYFQAQDQVCTMGGALGFVITDYTAC